MALKDWKKNWESKDKEWIIFTDKYGGTVDVVLIKGKWEVNFNKGLDGAKIFKNKSQALAYAKTYMRKN